MQRGGSFGSLVTVLAGGCALIVPESCPSRQLVPIHLKSPCHTPVIICPAKVSMRPPDADKYSLCACLLASVTVYSALEASRRARFAREYPSIAEKP